jgi:S1-C subfamily serine protease
MLKAVQSLPIRAGLVKCALALALWATPVQAQPKTEHVEMLYTVALVRASGSTGSGTVIYSAQRDGGCQSYVLTNHHVIDGAISFESVFDPKEGKKVDKEKREEVRVEWWDYNNLSRAIGTRGKQAAIVGYDKIADLALLKLTDTERCVSPVAHLLPEGESLFVYEKAWSAGAGLGNPPFPTEGIIANLDKIMDGHRYIMATAPIIFGNSGGALFHYSQSRKRYELIGVPSRVSTSGFGGAVSHMGWSIPTETVYDFLRKNGVGFIVPAGK